MFTRRSPLGSIFFKCSPISLSILSISRARFLLGLSSDAKSYVLRGLPSSPLWQYEQRTPSARLKPIITGRRRVPGQSLGNTWRLDGFSGHDQLSCGRVGKAAKIISVMRLRVFPIKPGMILETSSTQFVRGHKLPEACNRLENSLQ